MSPSAPVRKWVTRTSRCGWLVTVFALLCGSLQAASPTAAPAISPNGGSFSSARSVTITDATPGATIYFTTNGKTPTTSSSRYTGAISVSSSLTIQAIATAPGRSQSPVSKAVFTIVLPTAAPTISPNGGSFNSVQSVTISDVTPGATIYFTNNGSTPTTSSTRYTGAFSVSSSQTIQAIATASGKSQSPVTKAVFTILCSTPTALRIAYSDGPADPTVVVANNVDQVHLNLFVTPARQVALSVAPSIGRLGNVATTPSGTTDGNYVAGSLPSGTATEKNTFTAQACGKAIASVTAPTIYNYNGFNVHKSVVLPWVFVDAKALDANGIQAVFESKNSFLKSFVFVSNTTGGFIDSNRNGRYDKGEPSTVVIPIGATGIPAAAFVASVAKTFGVNPRILLATAQKEKGLLNSATLPSKSTLDWAFGCAQASDFKNQWECSARTFANRFKDGQNQVYPYYFRGIGHNPGNGVVTVTVRIENEATYAQYKYTPYIQDQAKGGGVYLFESIWAGIK